MRKRSKEVLDEPLVHFQRVHAALAAPGCRSGAPGSILLERSVVQQGLEIGELLQSELFHFDEPDDQLDRFQRLRRALALYERQQPSAGGLGELFERKLRLGHGGVFPRLLPSTQVVRSAFVNAYSTEFLPCRIFRYTGDRPDEGKEIVDVIA